MRRRSAIGLLGGAILVGLAGCVDAADLLQTNPTGVPIVQVSVDDEATVDVVLDADCRADDVDVAPGETVEIVREDPDEACSISLFVDGEAAYEAEIPPQESHYLEVRADGAVISDFVAY